MRHSLEISTANLGLDDLTVFDVYDYRIVPCQFRKADPTVLKSGFNHRHRRTSRLFLRTDTRYQLPSPYS